MSLFSKLPLNKKYFLFVFTNKNRVDIFTLVVSGLTSRFQISIDFDVKKRVKVIYPDPVLFRGEDPVISRWSYPDPQAVFFLEGRIRIRFLL